MLILIKFNQAPLECARTTCKHGGECVGRWDDTKNICNCDMTSHTGKFCELSNITLEQLQFNSILIKI